MFGLRATPPMKDGRFDVTGEFAYRRVMGGPLRIVLMPLVVQPSWQDAIDLIRGKAGLCPETRAPEVYGHLGFDMERMVIEQLRKNKLDKPGADPRTPVMVQSFSDTSLRKMHDELQVKLPLVFLISGEGRAA
jgi:hypothetical protein